MPFTASHILAVAPFRKLTPSYLSLSGLIMGSMAPDFEFFVRITLYGVWGHTFWGIFLFDLPVSIACCLLFHAIVRDPLIINLPQSLNSRFERFIGLNWIDYFLKNYIKVICSVLIGIFTHFIWDNLTHHPNYVSPFYIPILLKDITLLSQEMPLYAWLQVFSSIVGMAGLLMVIYGLKPTEISKTISQKSKITFWSKVVVTQVLIIGLRYWFGVPAEKPFGQLVVISISAFMISLILNGWFWEIKNKTNEL